LTINASHASGRIDVHVNNAGHGYLAAVVVERMEKDIRANIFSSGGFVGVAGSGYYVAAKFAVEGLSKSLALEFEPLGIRVLLVEPGPFRTNGAGRSLTQSRVLIDDNEKTAGQHRLDTAELSGNQSGQRWPASAAGR
jgi:NAD(P)-dependent dehydrogenase (short-subunit alcohol dehydrogenase family)